MKLTLPREVLDTLPEPDAKGLVRLVVAIRPSMEGGEATVAEINDVPVPGGDEAAGGPDPAPIEEEEEAAMPSPDEIDRGVMGM